MHFQIADKNTLAETVATLGGTKLQKATQKGNLLTGEITLDASTPVLMTTLPYDADYTVTLDGKAVKSENVEGFLAVSPSVHGTHTVSIARPTSLGIDMLPTAIGLVGTLAALILLFLKSKKEKQEKTK